MAKEEIIGSPRRNLVFETSGVIRVKVGDKYYKLNYDKETTDDEDEESIESKIIIVDDILLYETGQYEYPGDRKIIEDLKGIKTPVIIVILVLVILKIQMLLLKGI